METSLPWGVACVTPDRVRRVWLTFSKQFGTVMTHGEVVRPLGIPGLSGSCGSATLAANAFRANLGGETRGAAASAERRRRESQSCAESERTKQKVSSMYRPRLASSWWVWSGGWGPGTPGDSCYGTYRTLAAAATRDGDTKSGFILDSWENMQLWLDC